MKHFVKLPLVDSEDLDFYINPELIDFIFQYAKDRCVISVREFSAYKDYRIKLAAKDVYEIITDPDLRSKADSKR